MSAPKPALGYRSRTEAVLALRADGASDPEIAARLGISAANVAALAASARRRKRPAEAHGRTVLFPADILDRLRPHADRRGVSVNELARRLVEAASDENLVDAILDDTPTQAPAREGA